MCDRCVCCGEIIPEGRQVCQKCEKMANEKRLTEKHYSGNGYYLKCSSECPCDGMCDECDKLFQAIDRLGEYEDMAEKTVDAVEVVRCKDCRFCKKHPTSDKVKMCTNENWNTEYYPLVHDNDFCSYGERKDNDITERN